MRIFYVLLFRNLGNVDWLQLLSPLHLLFIIVDSDTVEPKGIYQDVDDTVDTEHNHETDNTPHHVLLAFRTLVFVVSATDELHHSPEEDDKGNDKEELDGGVDDDFVYLEEEGINRVSICNSSKHYLITS